MIRRQTFAWRAPVEVLIVSQNLRHVPRRTGWPTSSQKGRRRGHHHNLRNPPSTPPRPDCTRSHFRVQTRTARTTNWTSPFGSQKVIDVSAESSSEIPSFYYVKRIRRQSYRDRTSGILEGWRNSASELEWGYATTGNVVSVFPVFL